MGIPVTPDDQKPLAYYADENTGVTTTIVRKSVPGGALSLQIGLFANAASAPTAKWLFVAVNALSDSEEAYMLATPGARLAIPVGELQPLQFPAADPLLRYAFTTDAATESVGNRVIQRIGSPV